MSQPASDASHGHGADHGLSHVMSWQMLVGVFAALIVLTILTVVLHNQLDIGWMNIWLAMGIAVVKSLLVGVFFMHLRYDRPLNAIFFGGTLLFVFLFIAFALVDVHQYEGDVEAYRRRYPDAIEAVKKPDDHAKH